MVGTKHNRAVCALAVVIAGALALAGCATQTSRAAGGQKIPPALAVATFAAYPGQLPLANAPKLTVNDLTEADGVALAVGSADGYPAIWRRDGGRSWTLATSLSSLPAQFRPVTLTSVVHGPAGWLAVGVPGPIILTSVNGSTWKPAGGPVAADLAGVTEISAAAGP